MAESNILFDDIFTIKSIDAEGKKFDRGRGHTLITTFTYQRTQGSLLLYLVSRLMATSESHGMHLALDFNTELYPLEAGGRFTFTLASSLSRGGEADEDARDVWRPDRTKKGLEADYDYVMYGKVRFCIWTYRLFNADARACRCTSLTTAQRRTCKFPSPCSFLRVLMILSGRRTRRLEGYSWR